MASARRFSYLCLTEQAEKESLSTTLLTQCATDPTHTIVASSVVEKKPTFTNVGCAAATTVPLTCTSTDANTLTAVVNGALPTIDGITFTTTGGRVLLRTQLDLIQNGCYAVATVGDDASPWVLTRTADMNSDTIAADVRGFIFPVEGGTTLSTSYWTISNKGIQGVGISPIILDNTTVTQTEETAINNNVDGTRGPQGAQGLQGADGGQGAQGSQGAQGFQGAQGTQGAQGSPGTAGTAVHAELTREDYSNTTEYTLAVSTTPTLIDVTEDSNTVFVSTSRLDPPTADFSSPSAGIVQYDGTSTATFQVTFCASSNASTGLRVLYELRAGASASLSTVHNSGFRHRYRNASEFLVSFGSTVTLAAGDQVAVYATKFSGNNGDLFLGNYSLSLMRLG